MVRGCGVTRRYVDVGNGDVFGVINVDLDQLQFSVVYIYGRRYVCCGVCYIVSYERDEATPRFVLSISAHGGKVMYFRGFCSRSELCFLNGDDVCMCVVY